MSSYNPEGISLNIPEKLYVGVQGCKDFNKEDPPLAFAIPHGTKDFSTRRATVDSWAGYGRTDTVYQENPNYGLNGDYDFYLMDENRRPLVKEVVTRPSDGFIIDNELLEGFYFDKHVSRWQTNNKFFRITDPRGFQLEIDCENLGDILLNCAISQGYLVGKFQWTRHKGKAYLVRENHPARQRVVAPKVKRKQKTLVPGDVIKFTSDEGKWIYVGKVRAIAFSDWKTRFQHISGITTPHKPENRNSYSSRYYDRYVVNGEYDPNNYTEVRFSAYYKDTKSLNMFVPYEKLYYKHNKKIEILRDVLLMRGQGTFELLEEGKEVPEIPIGKPIKANCTSTRQYVSYFLLYTDKKQFDAIDCTQIDFNSLAEEMSPFTSRVRNVHTLDNGRWGVRQETLPDPIVIPPREMPNESDYYSQY